MSKLLKIFFITLAMFVLCSTAISQTKPKTPAKKTTKAPVKKPAETSGYVCTSSKDKFYHKRSSCGGLNKCSETVKYCATQGELAKWKRKRCTRCYNM